MKNFKRRQKLETIILDTTTLLVMILITVTVCTLFMDGKHTDVTCLLVTTVYLFVAGILIRLREKKCEEIENTFTRLEPINEIEGLTQSMGNFDFFYDNTEQYVIIVKKYDYTVTKVLMPADEISKFFKNENS